MTQRILAAVLCLCLLLGGLNFRAEAVSVVSSGESSHADSNKNQRRKTNETLDY